VQSDPVLEAAMQDGAVLCTLIAVEGGFSRAPGAQLCVLLDGSVVGDMTGGCLEAALVSDSRLARDEKRNRRVSYGKGSRYIDIQLPCGGGVELYVDAAPDKGAIAEALDALQRRQDAQLTIDLSDNADTHPANFVCKYHPKLRLLLFGHGPEVPALRELATVWGCDVEVFEPTGAGRPSGVLALGQAPVHLVLDRYTAVVLLFHDHDWEDAILDWALKSDAFYVGALGGHKAVLRREEALCQRGLTAAELQRLHGPVGLIPAAKDAPMLAISILAEVTQAYGTLCGRLK
jgi:xanthine dehydrogenase accessory factor